MKYTSFTCWIAKYCDWFYFFLFVICVCLHPQNNYINTQGVKNLRTVKASHWCLPSHRWCAPLVKFCLSAALVRKELAHLLPLKKLCLFFYRPKPCADFQQVLAYFLTGEELVFNQYHDNIVCYTFNVIQMGWGSCLQKLAILYPFI